MLTKDQPGSDKASNISNAGVQWLARQRSVQNSTRGGDSLTGKAARKNGRTGIQSPPQPSPLKLRRSASFIDVSPIKGSLIVEQ